MCMCKITNESRVNVGFRVKYNLKKPLGTRVVELKALFIECRIPQYEYVKKERIYKVKCTITWFDPSVIYKLATRKYVLISIQ